MPMEIMAPARFAGELAVSGTYLLLMHLYQPQRLRIGRLGWFDLPSGVCAYAGSAFGPGGLAARVSRHLRAAKRLHWHIDYLLAAVAADEVWVTCSTERLECQWAGHLLRTPGASAPVAGFGASDCACGTHLVHWAAPPAKGELQDALGVQIVVRGEPAKGACSG